MASKSLEGLKSHGNSQSYGARELIDVLKNMQLTEEEELQISISEEGRAQVIEECS